MAPGSRQKDIKLLVEKFIRLVESLNPGERLTIRKVSSRKRAGAAGPAAKNRKKTRPRR
jgi:hypothetical protein